MFLFLAGETKKKRKNDPITNVMSTSPYAQAGYIDFDVDGYPYITLSPTPSNFANAALNDRWSHWHRMIITTATADGYVLGTLPVPEDQLIGGSWSLSGADAALFSINASTGQITLADAASVTAGNKSITVTTPAGGAYAITVPVLDDTAAGTTGSGSFRFYDSVDGDEGNAGTDVQDAKQLRPTSTPPQYSYYKAGGEYEHSNSTVYIFSNSFSVPKYIYSYGDPSAARPRIYAAAGFTDDTNLMEVSSSSNANNNIADGIDWDGNGVVDRIFGEDSHTGLIINNCTIRNNHQSTGSQGVYFSTASNFTFTHNDVYDIHGDGLYIRKGTNGLVMFNEFAPVAGSGADCMQIVHENNRTRTNYRIYVYCNAFQVANDTGKGGLACEGVAQIIVEGNGSNCDFFGMAHGSWQGLHRDNVVYNKQPSRAADGIASGAEFPSGRMRITGNTVIYAADAFHISGYNADKMAKYVDGNTGGFMRVDVEQFLNTGINSSDLLDYDQPHSGIALDNVAVNTPDLVDYVNKGVADLAYTVAGGHITSVTSDGTDATVTFDGYHDFWLPCSITVAGFNETEYNGTFSIKSIGANNTIVYTHTAGTPATPATGNGTLTGAVVYGTIDYATNHSTSNVSKMPSLVSLPFITAPSNVATEGYNVGISYTLKTNQTAEIRWLVNGKIMTDYNDFAYFTVPYDYSDYYKDFDLSSLGVSGLDTPDVACKLLLDDGLGNKSVITSIWSDTSLPNKLIVNNDENPADMTDIHFSIVAPNMPTVTVDGSNDVTAVEDQIGSNDLAAIGGQGKPSYGGRIINNYYPAIDLDGTGEKLAFPSGTFENTTLAVIVVHYPDDTDATYIIGNAGTSGAASRFYIKNQAVDFGNSEITSGTLVSGEVVIQACWVTGTGAATQGIKCNNYAQVTGSVTNNTKSTSQNLGSRLTTDTGATVYDGGILEIHAFTSFNMAEINSKCAELATKYGATWTDIT